jgi:hypothetical protein
VRRTLRVALSPARDILAMAAAGGRQYRCPGVPARGRATGRSMRRVLTLGAVTVLVTCGCARSDSPPAAAGIYR